MPTQYETKISGSRRDLFLAIGAVVFWLAVIAFLDLADYFHFFDDNHKGLSSAQMAHWIAFLTIPSTWFAWRRWRESQCLLSEIVGQRADELRQANALLRDEINVRKQAEQSLRESERKLQNFAEAGSDWFWEMDEKLRFRFFSDNFTAITGVPQEVLLKRTRQETLIPNVDPDAWKQHLADLTAHRPFRDFSHPRTRPDGKTVILSISGKPVFDEDGAFKGYRGVGTDITSRTNKDAELLQLQKIEAIGQLSGGIAHDFNNLLSVILGNLQILERSIKEDGQALKRVRSALDATNRGAELTKRLLAFARKQTLNPKIICINDLLANMHELLKRTLGESIQLSIAGQEALWLAKVDSGQLEAAVLNLSINARDAMPDGGSLTITTKNVDRSDVLSIPDVDVETQDYVSVTVSDCGEGISGDVIANIFQPFFTTKPVDKGSGLGLSMVYGFVKQSSGYVDVSSEPGHGTTFKLYLPRSRGAKSDIYRTVSDEGVYVGGDETILVVEDNPAVQEIAVAHLENLGYRVLTANNGPSALEILSQERIDLLFSDMIMPGGMRGDQLTGLARQRYPKLKVLHCTGFAQKPDSESNYETAGSDLLLHKPYQAQDLAHSVRRALAS